MEQELLEIRVKIKQQQKGSYWQIKLELRS